MSKKLIAPTEAEDKAITASIAQDLDTWEMDAADFARAKRGLPFTSDPKMPVTLRLESDVLRYFRASGEGWQARVNAILRKAAGL